MGLKEVSASVVALLCLWTSTATADDHTNPVRYSVAIVGAGIGGSSTAYYLRNYSQGLIIDVFEAGSVGGRAQAFVFQNQTLELGASIIWDQNLYLARAVKELNLTMEFVSDRGIKDNTFAIWDGHKFVFQRTLSWRSYLGLLVRYGAAVKSYANHVGSMWAEQFKKIYDLQDTNISFTSPDALLKEVGLYNYTQCTAAQHIQQYLRRWYIWGADTFRTELAAAINRVNYNQRNTDLNALVGLISFAPASGGRLWSVAGGNSLLASSMLSASGALKHAGSTVVRVRALEDGRLSIWAHGGTSTQPGSEPAEYGTYDAVVLAAPLESANITFEGLNLTAQPLRRFQTTVATFVAGKLQAAYFGVSRLASENIMISEGAQAEFSSISRFNLNSTIIYKVFSSAALPRESLHRLFGPDAMVLAQRTWAAYPCFNPPERFAPFLLAPGLFYNNAIENAASAMEMSAISARNSALLVMEHLAAQALAAPTMRQAVCPNQDNTRCSSTTGTGGSIGNSSFGSGSTSTDTTEPAAVEDDKTGTAGSSKQS